MKFFWEVFVTLFVIVDPAGTVPVFLGLTRAIAVQLVANSAIASAHGA